MDQLPLPFGHSTWPCGTRSWPHGPLLMMSTASPLLNAFVSHNLIIFYFSFIQLPCCKLYFSHCFSMVKPGRFNPCCNSISSWCNACAWLPWLTHYKRRPFLPLSTNSPDKCNSNSGVKWHCSEHIQSWYQKTRISFVPSI